MQTVSTLCATGSIVSSASIGLAFGGTPLPPSNPVAQLESPPKTTEKKRRRSILLRGSTSGSPASLTPSRPATPLSTLVQPTPSPSPIVLHEEAESRTSPEVEHSAKIPDTLDERLYIQHHAQSTAQSSSLKRASSRISRRFSTWSLGPNSSPSDRPQSGRPATSSDRTSTFFSAPDDVEVARPPPNKLVKRSLSTRILGKSGEDAIVQTITLERPATRHKRSATLSSEAWTRFSVIGPVSIDHAHSRPMLPAYFTSISSQGSESSAGRPNLASFSEESWTRRLAPRSSTKPTLYRSNLVAAITFDTASRNVASDNPFAFGRTPSSSGLSSFFSSPEPTLDSRGTQPRRSSSVHNLFARLSPAKQRNKHSKVQSSDRRAVSAPASTMVGHSAAGNSEANIDQPSTKVQDEQPQNHISDTAPHTFDSSPLAQVATVPSSRRQSESPRSVIFGSPLANLSLQSGSRRSRHSVAISDMGSSQPGSEFDSKVFSSGDSDELRSDTAYDSIRTGMTKNSSNYQGPALETLFDSSPRLSSAQTSPLQLDMGTVPPMETKGQAIAEEDSSTSTPGRTVIQGPRESSEHDRSDHIPTEPATTTPALSLGRLPWESEIDQEEVDWPENIEEEDWRSEADVIGSHQAQSSQTVDDSLGSVRRKLKFLTLDQSNGDTGQRNDLLNWSESAELNDLEFSDSPSPRPQTAIGKKYEVVLKTDVSAGRASGGLHARSKSVPALADLAEQRSSAANKFGTWDIGAKGGIKKEDWDDDFDFEDPDVSDSDHIESFPIRSEPKKVMIVPDTIKAQQTNVLANIGLLKEWGLRIEELKDLKKMMVILGIGAEAHTAILEDIDGMIALADQEYDNHGFQNHHTPTSSPGFGFDDLVQPSPLLVAQDHDARNADDDDVELAPVQTPAHSSITSHNGTIVDPSSILNRPRKDSEAVAVSVIGTLQKQRSMKFLSTPDRPSAAKKIPFDTTTLKRIVPHVNDLVKSMKQIIGEAEGLEPNPWGTRPGIGDALHKSFFSPPNITEREKNDFDEDDDFW